MSPRFELRVLRGISDLLEKREQVLNRQRTIRVAVYLASWIAIFGIALFSRLDGRTCTLMSIVGIGAAGYCAGMAGFLGMAAKQWPAISPHVNRDSVAARIRELQLHDRGESDGRC
jgi:hypothetical protein